MIVKPNPYNFPQLEVIRYGHLLSEALQRIQASGDLILGEGVRSFERAFAAWLSPNLTADQVLGVANGTDALELALRSSGVGIGDRVILPSHTAYATLAAVLRLGAVPLFVDLEPGRPVLSVSHLRQILAGAFERDSGNTPLSATIKAVVAVHLYGESCDLSVLTEICHHYGLSLIEDCAQACGTLYLDRPVGSWGRFAAFSFYPTKNLAAFGDGGALVVNWAGDVDAVRRSRFYGWDSDRRAVQFGVNSRLDELQAWVLLGKLADLPQHIYQRRRIARIYSERLSGRATLPADGDDWRHSYHLFVIQVPAGQRDLLLRSSKDCGVPLGVHYPVACHQQPYVIERFGPSKGLTETERRVSEVLSLPLHPYMQEEQVAAVCECVQSLLPAAP